MVILRCISCLNLNWIKSYSINHNCFWQLCFSILEEKNANLFFLNGHFLTISGHFFASYINIFHITEVQTVILRCLVCQKAMTYYWLKCSCFHAWKCIISGVKYRSKFWYLRRKPSVMFSKWVFFQNSLVMSWAI